MNSVRTVNWWLWVVLMTTAALLVFATSAASGLDHFTPDLSAPGVLVLR